MARVALLTSDTAAPEMRDMFAKIESRGFSINNLYRVLAHSPELAPPFLNLGNAIRFKQALAPHLRELAILRVGQLNRAHYEWGKHVDIGLEAGVRQEQIDALEGWGDAAVFDARERAVLAYTDESSGRIRVGDAAYTALNDLFSEREIVELTITIGYYEMVCRLLEALQVELED